MLNVIWREQPVLVSQLFLNPFPQRETYVINPFPVPKRTDIAQFDQRLSDDTRIPFAELPKQDLRELLLNVGWKRGVQLLEQVDLRVDEVVKTGIFNEAGHLWL